MKTHINEYTKQSQPRMKVRPKRFHPDGNSPRKKKTKQKKKPQATLSGEQNTEEKADDHCSI
jgi:hypothetical protein